MNSRQLFIESKIDLRNLKELRKTGIMLASILPLWLAFVPDQALAVQATIVDGSASTGEIFLGKFPSWTVIRSVPLTTIGVTDTRCVATASLDARNPEGNGTGPKSQNYNFIISLDSDNPASLNASQRTVEVRQQPGVDKPDYWPVATNITFTGMKSGVHTIYFLGRKRDGLSPNMTVERPALSVVCTLQI